MAPAACATLSSSAPLACRGGRPAVDSSVQIQRSTTCVIDLSTNCGAAKGVHAGLCHAHRAPPQRTSSSERFTPRRASYSFLASSCKEACSTAAQHCRHSLWQPIATSNECDISSACPRSAPHRTCTRSNSAAAASAAASRSDAALACASASPSWAAASSACEGICSRTDCSVHAANLPVRAFSHLQHNQLAATA